MFKDRFDFRRQLPPVGSCLAIDDAAGNNKLNLRPGGRRAYERKLAHDAGGPLPHSLQTEVFLPATIGNRRVHANAIVANAQGEVVVVSEAFAALASMMAFWREVSGDIV